MKLKMRSSVRLCSLLLTLSQLAPLAVGVSPYLTEKPNYMLSCQINDADFVKCSTKSVQRVMDTIIENQGLPGLDSLPPIDPLYVKRIRVDQSGSPAVNLDVELTYIVVRGFNKMKIVESQVDPKDYHWETKIFLPKMSIRGNYGLKGRILLINLNGHGNMSLEIDTLNIDLYTTARLYEKGNFTFCNVTDAKASYTIDKLKGGTRFDNLFNGNKELEESTNAFFNENWATLNQALQPIIQSAISEILLKYMRAIFHFIPANFFVSDIPTSKQLYGE